MAPGQKSAGHPIQNLLGKSKQPDGIGNRGPVLPYSFGNIVLGKHSFFGQTPVGLRFLDRIQVLALNIFYQGPFQKIIGGNILDDRRDFGEAAKQRRPQAPLPAN